MTIEEKAKADDELLVKALTKLGRTQVEFYHPPSEIGEPPRKPFIRGINREGFYEDGSPLLTSLAAHFASGSTIEYMAKRGYGITIHRRRGHWEVLFFHLGSGGGFEAHDPDPARAVTNAFVQHEVQVKKGTANMSSATVRNQKTT